MAMLDSRPGRAAERLGAPGCAGRNLMQRAARDARCVSIRVLERLSESTLSLSWHDPTSFNYSEQVWALCTARKGGTCVLSGQSIRRGQPVYRPRRVGSSVPLNSGAMILALALVPEPDLRQHDELGE
jgi:hypothetical protein